MQFGDQEFLFTHSIDEVLSDGLESEFVCYQDDDDNRRKDQEITDTGKEHHVLPDVRKEIKSRL